MASFRITISPKRRAAARLVSDVRRALAESFAKEKVNSGLTQSEIARRLDVHRSVVSRELRGDADLSLGKVGELAWAMGKKAVFRIEDVEESVGQNHFEIKNETGSKVTPHRLEQNRIAA